MDRMKIVADNKIPYLRGVFESGAEVTYLPGNEIRTEDIRDADCLLIRTRTRCDRALLANTRVRFIGTATIGFDHIDTQWCEENGIFWTNAPGCNSGSVAQYITAALLEVALLKGFNLTDKTLGIIGVGHVGSKVEKIARQLGMTVLLNDPPRQRMEGPDNFVSLPVLLEQSDIVTLHVPLIASGPDTTSNLVNINLLEQLKPGAILINSARGEVLNDESVIRFLQEHPERGIDLVLDVWSHEPDLNRDLLDLAAIATPHIAGYSADGKYTATRMIVDAAAGFFGLTPGDLSGKLEDQVFLVDSMGMPQTGMINIIRASYSILSDDQRLRSSPERFEELRNNYPIRREFAGWTLQPFPSGDIAKILLGLGFRQPT
jgi:erythronate-4-phosphate dehydrogenase